MHDWHVVVSLHEQKYIQARKLLKQLGPVSRTAYMKGGRDMPTYAYHCGKCSRTFVVHMGIKEHETAKVQCPHCKGTEVEQILTPFVAMTSKKS